MWHRDRAGWYEHSVRRARAGAGLDLQRDVRTSKNLEYGRACRGLALWDVVKPNDVARVLSHHQADHGGQRIIAGRGHDRDILVGLDLLLILRGCPWPERRRARADVAGPRLDVLVY